MSTDDTKGNRNVHNNIENKSRKKKMSPERRRELIRKKKRKRRNRRIVFLLFVLLFIGSVWGAIYFKNTFGSLKRTNIDDNNLEISDKFDKNSAEYSKLFSDVTNIALYGVDLKTGDIQRSDTIMLGTIDTKHNKLKITSFMRDSYVDIPGHGYDKLNHAYAFGGPQLSIATINKNFDLNITDYVSVDFSELEAIVNAIGGVDIDLPDDAIEYTNDFIAQENSNNGTHIQPVKRSDNGLVHMTGDQALQYGRNRSTPGGDFDRTDRQRILMNAMFKKVSSMGTGKLAGLMTKLMPYVETSLSNSEIFTLASKVLSMDSRELEQCRFPRDDNAEDAYINGVYYLTFDEDITRNQIYEYIFKDNKVWENSDSNYGTQSYNSSDNDSYSSSADNTNDVTSSDYNYETNATYNSVYDDITEVPGP